MGLSTVITSGKGGVGKSTVSVGLGRALAQRGRRVLLIDCDAGLRSLDRMTGTEENLVFDISDVVYGRCAPAEAIYPCADADGLFLLPAPSSGENMIRPGVMRKLVPLLKRYYDHVLLDSPAGVGGGFRSAACAADRALIVCSPDPVCVRGANAVGGLLKKLSVEDQRLIINRFNGEFFDETGVYGDLDGVIDAAGIRLFGVVPEDFSLAASFLKGKRAKESSKGMMALCRIAGRLEGEMIPIPALL
ncbi:AAA family ATPase [uncultured Neglectibacter sp.]|uniref:nucleotide-binding protein n=1 Tax=uncultured Neglectibacter sp. TaxID=1924108 RepID=UPI0034DF8237